MNAAKLYLIPIPITDGALQTLSPEIATHTLTIKHYFVENIRTARRFLKALHPSIIIDELSFSEIDKHAGPDIGLFKRFAKEGHEIGIMSESGCPGIADPGAELVRIAQEMNITVVPLTGPSSILLSLMASGLNGQSFCFNGYLPVKDPLRSQKIKALETLSKKENQTQLFIETPYRNNALLDELLKHCQNSTRLCIALNITASNAFIKTKTVGEWKQHKPILEKEPAVFLILA
jgi:16S rRNA (cytidine1402-2'-O)-methyltransferase